MARFVDSSFWIALTLRRDQHHAVAERIWTAGTGALVTSELVLGETWTFISRRAGHRWAVEFQRSVTRVPQLSVRHVDEELSEEAWRWLLRHDERTYSFVDATSFGLMRRLRLREALAFDGDFSEAGFVEVQPP